AAAVVGIAPPSSIARDSTNTIETFGNTITPGEKSLATIPAEVEDAGRNNSSGSSASAAKKATSASGKTKQNRKSRTSVTEARAKGKKEEDKATKANSAVPATAAGTSPSKQSASAVSVSTTGTGERTSFQKRQARSSNFRSIKEIDSRQLGFKQHGQNQKRLELALRTSNNIMQQVAASRQNQNGVGQQGFLSEEQNSSRASARELDDLPFNDTDLEQTPPVEQNKARRKTQSLAESNATLEIGPGTSASTGGQPAYGDSESGTPAEQAIANTSSPTTAFRLRLAGNRDGYQALALDGQKKRETKPSLLVQQIVAPYKKNFSFPPEAGRNYSQPTGARTPSSTSGASPSPAGKAASGAAAAASYSTTSSARQRAKDY
ncbi:unnamed protein product, partial [Amoebophrya sp. A120]